MQTKTSPCQPDLPGTPSMSWHSDSCPHLHLVVLECLHKIQFRKTYKRSVHLHKSAAASFKLLQYPILQSSPRTSPLSHPNDQSRRALPCRHHLVGLMAEGDQILYSVAEGEPQAGGLPLRASQLLEVVVEGLRRQRPIQELKVCCKDSKPATHSRELQVA